MAFQLLHPSLRKLLLYADGELSLGSAKRLHLHLSACPQCAERLARLRAASGDHFNEQHADNAAIPDSAAQSALFKARLAEVAYGHTTSGQRSLRVAHNLAYGCALALLTTFGFTLLRQSPSASTAYAGMLPDHDFTPGATRQVSLADLCTADHDEVVRSVPGPLQQEVFRKYGIKDTPVTEFEVDYLITPGLGGADDVRNLWPEPHANTAWNSYVKDQLEDHLHHMVCDGKLSLADAQRDIATNWISAYKKYFHTDQPLVASQPLDPSRHLPVTYASRNLRTARKPSATNSAITVNCAIANGGSLPVGASACRAGTFRNDWKIATNTLRYNAMIELTT